MGHLLSGHLLSRALAAAVALGFAAGSAAAQTEYRGARSP